MILLRIFQIIQNALMHARLDPRLGHGNELLSYSKQSNEDASILLCLAKVEQVLLRPHHIHIWKKNQRNYIKTEMSSTKGRRHKWTIFFDGPCPLHYIFFYFIWGVWVLGFWIFTLFVPLPAFLKGTVLQNNFIPKSGDNGFL